uniref:NADH-ubiquinone oxidoreductase chain 2 n=1 Tax=Argas miniatus TaxID=1442166 RepID=W0FIC3_ARGMI|nr:NADH dehydrogenase subunit 2 [Argas miniatus]AHF21639.1 NADH dehydrogenase subunit 2 [Argas miniatus]
MTTILLFWTLLLSIIMSISTSSFFSLWICLEINMMVFIPMMNSKNLLATNSMIFYFISQSLASTIFIFSVMMNLIYPFMTSLNSLLLTSSILIKLGAAPFHIWFPEVMNGLKLEAALILISIQKIIPLYILSFMNNTMMILSIIFSAFVGGLGGWNQTSIMKILAFSSITHISWLISLIISANYWWYFYFFIYSFIMLSLMSYFIKNKMTFINQINISTTTFFQFFFIFTILSLGGLPPFIGFFLKMLSIKLIMSSMPFLLLFLIPSSLLNLYFYMRLMYPFLLKMTNKNFIFMKTKKIFSLIPLHMTLLLILIPLM